VHQYLRRSFHFLLVKTAPQVFVVIAVRPAKYDKPRGYKTSLIRPKLKK
jgi:hypothetical protein